MQRLNLETIGRFRCPKCGHYMSDTENICPKCRYEILTERKRNLADMEFNLLQETMEETEEKEFRSKSSIFIWSASWASLFVFTQILEFPRSPEVVFIILAIIFVVYHLTVFIRNRSRY